ISVIFNGSLSYLLNSKGFNRAEDFYDIEEQYIIATHKRKYDDLYFYGDFISDGNYFRCNYRKQYELYPETGSFLRFGTIFQSIEWRKCNCKQRYIEAKFLLPYEIFVFAVHSWFDNHRTARRLDISFHERACYRFFGRFHRKSTRWKRTFACNDFHCAAKYDHYPCLHNCRKLVDDVFAFALAKIVRQPDVSVFGKAIFAVLIRFFRFASFRPWKLAH